MANFNNLKIDVAIGIWIFHVGFNCNNNKQQEKFLFSFKTVLVGIHIFAVVSNTLRICLNVIWRVFILITSTVRRDHHGYR